MTKHRVDVRPREAMDRREPRHKSPVVGNHGRDARLLQHDLRQPDAIRIASLPPIKVALLPLEPIEQGAPKRGQFLLGNVQHVLRHRAMMFPCSAGLRPGGFSPRHEEDCRTHAAEDSSRTPISALVHFRLPALDFRTALRGKGARLKPGTTWSPAYSPRKTIYEDVQRLPGIAARDRRVRIILKMSGSAANSSRNDRPGAATSGCTAAKCRKMP